VPDATTSDHSIFFCCIDGQQTAANERIARALGAGQV